MIVADSNLVAYLLIPGDKSALADAIFQRDPEWGVPLLCRSELRNILSLYMRHQGMNLIQAKQTMERAEGLFKGNEFAVPSDAVLELTSRNNISAYDAEFIVLARQLGTSLVTFDRAVLKTFSDVAVHPHDFKKR